MTAGARPRDISLANPPSCKANINAAELLAARTLIPFLPVTPLNPKRTSRVD